jgi:hypothetical protein
MLIQNEDELVRQDGQATKWEKRRAERGGYVFYLHNLYISRLDVADPAASSKRVHLY